MLLINKIHLRWYGFLNQTRKYLIMQMSDLPLARCAVSGTGIESGDYFAVDIMGHAMIYRCRTYAHGVVFDDREEPVPFGTTECYYVQIGTDVNIRKLQHQCILDRNRALGIKGNDKSYEQIKSEELAVRYGKKRKN